MNKRDQTNYFVIVGNPENRRITLFQAALHQQGLPPAIVVSYLDLMAGRDSLARFDDRYLIRFESPGRNFEVERAIIAAGAAVMQGTVAQRISASQALTLTFEKGRIWYPRQWYLGFQRLLTQWQTERHAPCLNQPADIILMFDKPSCQQMLAQQEIPVPPLFGPIESYDHLQACLADTGYERLFIKLAYGSSASGVMAYQRTPQREFGFTTIELVAPDRFYNSRKIRRYTKRETLSQIINFLAREGCQVEAWLPKAKWQGKPFDIRVVMINGQAQHTIVRLGRSPITNLHLGNDRCDMQVLQPYLKATAWQTMQQACQRVAQCFPDTLHCGLDLLISPNFQEHAILEVNAFGDLLPGVLYNGLDTYQAQIQAVLSNCRL